MRDSIMQKTTRMRIKKLYKYIFSMLNFNNEQFTDVNSNFLTTTLIYLHVVIDLSIFKYMFRLLIIIQVKI